MQKSSSSRQKTKNTPLPPKEKIRFSFSRFMFLKWASTQPAIVKSIQIIVKFCDGFPGIKPFSSFFHCTGNFFKTSFFLGKCFFFYYNTHDVVRCFPIQGFVFCAGTVINAVKSKNRKTKVHGFYKGRIRSAGRHCAREHKAQHLNGASLPYEAHKSGQEDEYLKKQNIFL